MVAEGLNTKVSEVEKENSEPPRTAKQEAVKENMPNQVQEQTKYSSLRGVHVSFYISQVRAYMSHTTSVFTNLFRHIRFGSNCQQSSGLL